MAAADENDGKGAARLLNGWGRLRAIGEDQVRNLRQQFHDRPAYPTSVASAPMEIDLKVTADAPAELFERLPERRSPQLPCRIAFGIEHQHTDASHALGLLRVRCEWPS